MFKVFHNIIYVVNFTWFRLKIAHFMIFFHFNAQQRSYNFDLILVFVLCDWQN